MSVEIPVPLSDLLDRICILRVKLRRMRDGAKLANVRRHLGLLEGRWSAVCPGGAAEEAELERVNEELWDVEDALRRHERDADFGEDFVLSARRVYLLNDRRAALKRQVDLRLGSELLDEKEYLDHRR